MKNITSVRYDWSSGYCWFSCVSRDGNIYAGGKTGMLNTALGFPRLTDDYYLGWESTFPMPAVDSKILFSYDGTTTDVAFVVLLADGSVYAAGSANAICNNALSTINTFVKLALQ